MDIVEYLRDACRGGDGCKCTLHAAADEIIRLRDENASMSAQLIAFQAAWPGGVDEVSSVIGSLRDENAKLLVELSEIASALPGPIYMDPPDGGSVTVAEQVGRMAKDAERYRWLLSRDDSGSGVGVWMETKDGSPVSRGWIEGDQMSIVIDAAMRKRE